MIPPLEDDPIIEEIHRIRQKIAERFNYDIHAIAEDARKRQVAEGRPMWSGAEPAVPSEGPSKNASVGRGEAA